MKYNAVMIALSERVFIEMDGISPAAHALPFSSGEDTNSATFAIPAMKTTDTIFTLDCREKEGLHQSIRS